VEISLDEYDALLGIGEASVRLLTELSLVTRILEDAVREWSDIKDREASLGIFKEEVNV
jgi:hypothetical protein